MRLCGAFLLMIAMIWSGEARAVNVIAVPSRAAPSPLPSASPSPVPQPSPSPSPSPVAVTVPVLSAADLAAYRQMRDPFRSPPAVNKVDASKPELETVSVADLVMVGVLAGVHNKNRAIIRAPSGKVYIVTEGTHVGVSNGFIKRIMNDRLLVNETQVDVVGDKTVVSREIHLVNRPSRFSVGENSSPQTVSETRKEGAQ